MLDNFKDLTDSQRMVIILSSLAEQSTKLNRHHTILVEGDGEKEKPLLERVRNLEAFIDALKFWQRTIALALVLQTITFGVAAIAYFVRLYPLLNKIANSVP